MVKVHKRASKRVGTKQKSKILKKVREHHRKSKRQAKKDPTWRSKKKVDPGIPNSYPYKEELLNEIEQRRMAAEQAKRDAREGHQNGNKDEDVEGDEGEEDDEMDEEASDPAASTSIAAIPRLFRGTLSDFYSSLKDQDGDPRIVSVILLLDARDPASWWVADLAKEVQSSKCNLTVALTKCDLVPLEVVAAWTAHLSSSSGCSVFPICTPEPAKNGKKARAGGGIANLVTHLESLCGAKEGKGKGKEEGGEEGIAIVGIENSGRTALANILAPLLPNVCLFDTPSIVPASSRLANVSEEESDEEDSEETLRRRDEEAAHRILIRNSGSIFKVREPLPLIEALMKRVQHESDLMMALNVPAFTDTNDFLIAVARTQGRLKKGAVPDTIAASRTVLRLWSTGELGYYSIPPRAGETSGEAKVAIEKDASLKNVVLSRKEWRSTWDGKELRLASGTDGMLGTVKLALSKPAEIEEEEEDDEEDEDEDEDEELEDDDEELEDEEDEEDA